MIYNVVLIDDNPITLKSLSSTINWNGLGLKVVGCFENGLQGYENIKRLKPDIIITDIHMPEMDGLTMVERLVGELEDCRIIFITGYDMFQYATRAIKLSAFDFILKPVDNKELEKSLQRAVISLKKERENDAQGQKIQELSARIQLLVILSGGVKNVYDDSAFWKCLDIPLAGYFIIILNSEQGLLGPIVKRLEIYEFPQKLMVISTVIDGELVLFCGVKEQPKEWKALARSIVDQILHDYSELTVVVSDWHLPDDKIYRAYQESRNMLFMHNIYGRHTNVEFYTEQVQQQRSPFQNVEQICSKLAQKVDDMAVDEIWNAIYEKSEGHIRIIRLMLMFFCTKVVQEKVSHVQYNDQITLALYDISRLTSVEIAREWFDSFYEKLGEIHSPINSILVSKVLEYVKNHATEGLVLDQVAEQFYVSPNYLSTLIRKETGVTYRQHVINAKLAVAKQMLDDTRMRVEDIAYYVGYENYISFYNIFKKVEKLSPTEYRARNNV